MTDKDSNQNKLPYIVLPSLASKESKGIGKRNDSKVGITNGSSRSNKFVEQGQVKQPEPSKLPLLSPLNGRKAGALSTKDISSSKALNRHITIKKQTKGKHSRDIQETESRMLLARGDMQQSPHRSPIYANGDISRFNYVPKEDDDAIADEVYEGSVELSLLLNEKDSQGQRRKALESLVQLFPHRVRKPKSTRIAKSESPCSSFHNNSSSDENIKMIAAKLGELSCSKQDSRNNHQKAESKSEDQMTASQIQSKFDSITVHIHNRDAVMSQLSQDLIDLQLLVLKEKKESEKSKNTISKLENEIRRLEGKLRSVECAVEGQEKKILEKLFLFDEIETTDSDSDFGSSYKPANWNTTRYTTGPAKSASPSPSAIGTLKECTNWIPVAPDFDKLINIISLMNIRMDRNQSMKLQKKGNTASFQHSDTTNLILYKNGLILGTSSFRSYTSLSVIKLINEIFQGYFPSELQSQYPEGVVFVIIDRRASPYDQGENSFFGEGNMLKDSSSIPKLIPGNDCTSLVVDKGFTNGSDTDISSLALSSQTSLLSVAPFEPMLKCLPDLESESYNSNLILLKLKNSENGETYKLKVSNSCSINDLLEHLVKYIKDPKYEEEGSSNPLAKYELMQPVPYGILTSGTSTLKDYGIVQNTLLYFKHLP